MELATEDLSTYIQRTKDYRPSGQRMLLKESQVLRIALQVLYGLRHLHSKNTIHRDIKPLNCLLMNGLDLKISDFGVVRQLSNDISFAMSEKKGTKFYAAPEIHLNKPHQKSVDIWSFGVLLYELCTLNRPFSTLEKILKPDPEYRPVDEEEYRQELRDLIDDCLTSDPSARPTVDQILERPFLVAFSEEFDKQNRSHIRDQQMLLKENAISIPKRINFQNEVKEKILSKKIIQNPKVNSSAPIAVFVFNQKELKQEERQPIFDLHQQPRQQIFDIPSYNNVPNPVQVLLLNTQVQNQTTQPNAQVQEVQPIFIENAPISKQGGFQRSLIVREFATVNKHGHLNCFLNVCLQALWQFQWVRRHLLQLCKEGDLGGAQELRPFIESLKSFYQGVLRHDSKVDCSLHEYEGLEVRKELFKLFYDKVEFALHGTADASEALDQILVVIHGWLSTKQLREKDTFNMFQCSKQKCNQNCFVHQGFFQQQVKVSNCSCGKQSEPLYSDSNLFATTVKTLDLLQTLKNVQSSTDTELAKLSAYHQVFIDALKWKMSLKRPNCTDPSTNNTDGRHNSSQETFLMNSPEVITFNLKWDGLPSAKDILSILISVPENFDSIKLFKIPQPNVSQKYIFKGMICQQAAHYLCFFKRAPIKFSYVVKQQEFNWDQQWKKMWYESTSEEAEWTLYDDAEIVSKGSWAAVIEQCVEFSCYPTVLFFEKLESEDVNYLNQYKSSHKLNEKQIFKLFDLAQKAQGLKNLGSGFSQEEISAQIQLGNQFNKDKAVKKTDVVEKKPVLDQVTLKMLRTKYKQYGIFLFSCNQCSDGIQALHVKKCIKPECKGINYFQQINPPPDKVKWRECLAEILIKMKWISNPNQPVKPQESKPITEPTKSEQINPTKIEELKKPLIFIDKPVETVQKQKPIDTNPQSIIQNVALQEVQQVKVQDLAQVEQEKVKYPIKNQQDLVGQNKNYDAIDLEIRQKNHMQDPIVTIWANQQQQIQSNPQSFKSQQEWGMPPEQIIQQELQKNKVQEELKVDLVKRENQEKIQPIYLNVKNHDEVNENKADKIDKETQDLIDLLEREQEAEIVEGKITVWKCPNCVRLMALQDKCDGCNRSIDNFDIEVQFEEVTKQAYEAARKNVEVVKIKEEQTETMWLCPECKVYMKLDKAACIKCHKEIQHFENIKYIPLEKMLVQVKLSELNDILKKQDKVEAIKIRSEIYWMCPRGCSDKSIKFNATCRVCYENFMYYSMDKHIITNEDLFGSEDEPSELWSCFQCKKHNIDIKKACSKCKKTKYSQQYQIKEEMKEKNKEYNWKCYFCNYTNKYLKNHQCDGCKKFARSTSEVFEVKFDYRPKVKVVPPQQIEIANKIQESIKFTAISDSFAKPVQKLERLQWQCSCGQKNIGFTICICCKRQKPQQEVKKVEQPKLPEKTWMCKFCRELNYSEEWVKISTAYCQTCKKLSEERSKEILIALSKHYKERECEKCKQNVFIKFDQNACDDCLQNDDDEVLANEDFGEMRTVYQSGKNQRENSNLCSICCGKLKVTDNDGFCNLCIQKQKMINKGKKQEKQEQLFD